MEQTLFTVLGRIRLIEARKKQTGKSDYFVCERGFMYDGIPFSDQLMLEELVELKVDIATALVTPAPDEDKYVNARLASIAATD